MFQVGDVVHVSKQKLTFEKGYETNWTEALFVVTECAAHRPSSTPNQGPAGRTHLRNFLPSRIATFF